MTIELIKSTEMVVSWPWCLAASSVALVHLIAIAVAWLRAAEQRYEAQFQERSLRLELQWVRSKFDRLREEKGSVEKELASAKQWIASANEAVGNAPVANTLAELKPGKAKKIKRGEK